MIQFELDDLSLILFQQIPIQEVYLGLELIWGDSSLICFTNGYWVDDFPWDDNSYWMD